MRIYWISQNKHTLIPKGEKKNGHQNALGVLLSSNPWMEGYIVEKCMMQGWLVRPHEIENGGSYRNNGIK